MRKYQIIYADPPWDYNGSGFPSTELTNSYPLMSTREICSLPVRRITSQNCVLFLWVPMSQLPEAFRVIDAWGFTYVSNGFTWIKTNKTVQSLVLGMGYWTRQNAELCLVAKRGRPSRRDASVSSVVVSPRGRHSAKPKCVRERIVQICGDVPRVELFARERALGWDVWGNELSNDVELQPLVV